MKFHLRKALLGNPVRSEFAHEARLPILLALPIFASDALSSVAYASETILRQLGHLAIHPDQWKIALPISIAIVALILMVVVSYRQVIYAYPQGGGSYIVARENLGLFMGLVAASALLVDYVLTVAVSIADCVAQSFSALGTLNVPIETLKPMQVTVCVMAVLLITLVNLRGVKESGAAFAGPSYGFIAVMITLIVVGVIRLHTTGTPIDVLEKPLVPAVPHDVDWIILLRGFASGCAALTGIEAVSNGVTAFRKPEARNAVITLGILGGFLAFMFIGISYLAVSFNITPTESETVISQIAKAAFGTSMPGGIMYYAVLLFTAAILFLAANTAFAGFPRLGSILAEDGYLPRQLATLGDRLAYNNGIIALGLLAAGFLVVFHGEAHALLPLYTIGVFIAFTTAQAGMVVKGMRTTPRPWAGLVVNGLGCVVTFVVLIVVTISKFVVHEPALYEGKWFTLYEGAWMALMLMGLVIWLFVSISKHYKATDSQLAVIPAEAYHPFKHTVIVLVPTRIHRGIVTAINYARTVSEDAVAVHISFDRSHQARLREAWYLHGGDMPLIVLDSPYRSLVAPLMAYLDAAETVHNDDIITVVLPEFVPAKWWHHFLHNASGWLLRIKLFYRPDIVIISVRYYLEA